jgi:hypothetical protein
MAMLLLCSIVDAQIFKYGQGCRNVYLQPSVHSASRIGTTLVLEVRRPIGLSHVYLNMGLHKLNIPLSYMGYPANCFLHAAPVASKGPTVINWHITIFYLPIPLDINLLGKRVFFQAVDTYPLRPLNTAFSNGLELVLY